MCGVFGIIGDYTPEKARIALADVYPIEDGIIVVSLKKKGFFLAHQRLSITDNHHQIASADVSQKSSLEFQWRDLQS